MSGPERTWPQDDRGPSNGADRSSYDRLDDHLERVRRGLGAYAREQTDLGRERAAAQLEALATRIRERDSGLLIEDAGRLARRRPELVFALGAAIGFLAARLLRGSASTIEGE